MSGLRHRWTRDEHGLTLVELMVVLVLMAVVLGAVASGAIGLLRGMNQVDVRTENVDHARLAVGALSRDLRAAASASDGAPAFAVAGPFEAEFHARIGDGRVPVLIRIEVDADDRIVETLTPPTVNSSTGQVTYPVANRRQRYVASYLHNDMDASAGQPMLRYGRLDGDEVVWMTPTATTAAGTPTLSELDRRSIRIVEIDLRMARDRERRVDAQRVRTEVRVPNQRDGS